MRKVAWFQCFSCFFAFRDTNSDTLVFLRSETRDVATRVSERKWVQSTELDIVNGSFCNLCALALGWRYISSLHSADELQQERNSCPQLRSCFIHSGHVGVSKRFSRSISLAVYCLYTTYIDVRTVKFFPPAESWLVDSNFPRKSRMQGLAWNVSHLLPSGSNHLGSNWGRWGTWLAFHATERYV